MSLVPGSHAPTYSPAKGLHRDLVLSQKVGSSQVHAGPQGVQKGLCPPQQDTQARPGAGWVGRRLGAEPLWHLPELGGPSTASGTTEQPPTLGWALLTGFGKIKRRKKEGVGGRQEVKGALVLLSSCFIVKNWPQTLSTGTRGQIFLCHTHLPVTANHATQLTAHTETHHPPPFSPGPLPALAQPSLGTSTTLFRSMFFPRIHPKPSARAEIKALLFLAPGKCWGCTSKRAAHTTPRNPHLYPEHG